MPLKTFQYGGSFNDHDQPAFLGDMEVRCAWHECNNLVSRDHSYSFVITFMTRGPDARLGSFQCPDVDDVLAGHLHAQHFCCSGECAVKAAHACIDEHLVPRHNQHVDMLTDHDAQQAAIQDAMEAHRAEVAQTAQEPPASANASTPPADASEDVAQLVQQPEAPDAAAEAPQHAEPATEDDGPPTLLTIPVVPQAPVDADLVHHGPPPEAVPIPDATEPAESIPVTADDSTPELDAAPIEAISDVAHDGLSNEPEPVDAPTEASEASTPDATATPAETPSDVIHESEGETSHDAA